MTARNTDRFIGRLVSAAAVLAFFSGAHTSDAGLIQVQYEGNDCAGVFSGLSGGGFDYCSVIPNDEDVELSPIIIKFDADDLTGEVTGVEVDDEGNEAINSLFPSIDAEEFLFTGGGVSGMFLYDPGEDDPAIKYWAAKGGSAFNLHFYVNGDPEACTTNPMGVDCLSLATVIPTGVYLPWFTDNGNFLSHLSFYDTEGPEIQSVEPATLSVLGIGLLALSRARQRRRNI